MSLKAEKELGEEIAKFLQTDIGKYLDGCTSQDIESAKDDLLELDPHKYTSLTELQNAMAGIQKRARTAESLRQYLSEAILNGNQAEHQLEHEGED